MIFKKPILVKLLFFKCRNQGNTEREAGIRPPDSVKCTLSKVWILKDLNNRPEVMKDNSWIEGNSWIPGGQAPGAKSI